MTAAPTLDIQAEVARITADLAARADPAYVAGMRRTMPSALPAHAVRVPKMRKVSIGWLRQHKDATPEEVLELAEALWSTGWREEACVAIGLIAHSPRLIAALPWTVIERWSSQIENWEHVDWLAGVTGRLLIERPALLLRVKALSRGDHPWQRRLALVTLIVAFMKAEDGRWRAELASMAEALRQDKHPLVRRAVVWARDRLAKDHLLSPVEGRLDA